MDKNMDKNVWGDVCVSESPCCTAEINTTLWINYTSIKYIFLKIATKILEVVRFIINLELQGTMGKLKL